MHTGKLDAKFKATLENSTRWQYYGTPGINGSLRMTWDRTQVNAERVNLELWGYMETGENVFSSTLEILKSHYRENSGFLLPASKQSNSFTDIMLLLSTRGTNTKTKLKGSQRR